MIDTTRLSEAKRGDRISSELEATVVNLWQAITSAACLSYLAVNTDCIYLPLPVPAAEYRACITGAGACGGEVGVNTNAFLMPPPVPLLLEVKAKAQTQASAILR